MRTEHNLTILMVTEAGGVREAGGVERKDRSGHQYSHFTKGRLKVSLRLTKLN